MKKFIAKKCVLDALKSLCMWHRDIEEVRNIVYNMYVSGLFVDSKFAKKMLRDTGIDSCRKAKYILPLVIDTWNITKQNGFKEVEVKMFNKPKIIMGDKLDNIRYRYHKKLVTTLIINDNSLFGNFLPDKDTTYQYECY